MLLREKIDLNVWKAANVWVWKDRGSQSVNQNLWGNSDFTIGCFFWFVFVLLICVLRLVISWLSILFAVFYGGCLFLNSETQIYWTFYKQCLLNLEEDEQNLSGRDWKNNWILPSWNEPLWSWYLAFIELTLISLNSVGVQSLCRALLRASLTLFSWLSWEYCCSQMPLAWINVFSNTSLWLKVRW